MFSRVFATLGAKTTVNTAVFGGSEAQNHGIYDVFFASASKNNGIHSVFWPAPSKNTRIYTGFTMLQDVVSISEKDKKTVNYNVLGLAPRVLARRGGGGY